MYICINESGNKSQDGFVVIGGYITKDIYQVRSAYKKSEKVIKQSKGIDLKTELKVATFNKDDKKLVLNSLLKIPAILPFCFYYKISSHKNISKTRNNQFDFSLINSILETLLSKTYLEEKYHYINTDEEVVLELNDTLFKAKLKNKLKDYLQKKNPAFEIGRTLKHVICPNASNSFEIRAAHLFCNYFWAVLNHFKTNYYLQKEIDISIYHAQINNYSEHFITNQQQNVPTTTVIKDHVLSEDSSESQVWLTCLTFIFRVIWIIICAFFYIIYLLLLFLSWWID